MYMLRCCPLMAVVPISLFLTASFFVLFALRKVTDKWLKLLGYSAVSLLLLAALVIFSSAVFNLAEGFGEMRCPMPMKMKKCSMMQMMRQDKMPEIAMPEKRALPNE